MVSNIYIPPPLGLLKPSKSEISYTLVVVQNPERTKCCGFSEKERRPIDPPPIVQLKATIYGQETVLTSSDTKLFTLQCDLYSEDTTQSCSLVYSPPYCSLGNEFVENVVPVRNLLGSVVSNAFCLNNLNNEPGVYFVFYDLSVRTEGTFTLQFRFSDLDAGEPMTMSTLIQAEVFSKPFKVYTPKNFLGMGEPTALSKCFSNQGVKIVTRSSPTKKKLFLID